MADIKAIVQRMIDAGESEENIATVIRSQPKTLGPNTTGEARIGADPHPGSHDFTILGIPIHVPGPDKPRADENMADIGGVGIPPESVVMGPLQAGRAMMRPGLSLVGRAAAGGSSLLNSVAPVIKYEVAKHALEKVGLPSSVATVAAVAISGYKRSGPTAVARTAEAAAPEVAAATTPTAAAPVEAAAAGPRPVLHVDELRDWQTLKDSGLSNRAAADAVVAKRGQAAAASPQPAPVAAAPAPAPEAPAAPAATLNTPSKAMTAAREAFAAAGETARPAEASNAMELIRRGKSPADAVATVIKNRPKAALSPAELFNQKFGTLSDTDVQAALDARNASGQIKTPSAATARARRIP